jgi:hypothetical protein
VEEAFNMRDEFRTERQNCKPKLTAQHFFPKEAAKYLQDKPRYPEL